MAKIVLGEADTEGSDWAFVVVNSLTVIRKTSKVFTYVDEDGDTLTFHGRNLKYDGDDFSGGRITSISVQSPEQVYATVTDINLRAGELPGDSPPIAGALRNAVTAGDDLFIGSGHTDR